LYKKATSVNIKTARRWNLICHNLITQPLIYHPAVVFRHLRLNALSLPQGNVGAKFDNVIVLRL
jgi:hypothetical protein